MGLDQRSYDGKAEARPPPAPDASRVGPPETLEDPRLIVQGDPRSFVGDRHFDVTRVAGDGNVDWRAGRGMNPGVGEQVIDDLAQADGVTEDDRVAVH